VDITLTPDVIEHPSFTDRSSTSLHTIVNECAKGCYKATTLASTVSKVKSLAEFCREHLLLINSDTNAQYAYGQQPKLALPDITPILMCYYVAWLYRRGHTTYDSINAYVSAIATFCRVNRRPSPRDDPTTGTPDHRLFAVCRGLKSKMGKPKANRYPVMLFHQDGLITSAAATLPPMQCANIVAATLMAFTMLLRVSEFTYSGTLDPTTHAQRNDIKFLPDSEHPTSVQFTIKASKTDPWRESITITVQANSARPDRCLVRAMKQLFDTDPQQPSAPLFNFGRDKAHRTSSRQQFTNLCNTLFKHARIDSMYLKSHSFRQGGATALLAAGAPIWVIKIIGRWRSDSWQAYTFTDQQTIARWTIAATSEPSHEVDYDTAPPLRIMSY
jgi:hypothetical protein